MKTLLDKVIKALESARIQVETGKGIWVDYRDDNDLKEDVLQYLKAYKRVLNKIEKIALGSIEDTLGKLDNPPLTWDELREMKGKPAWIETDNVKFWTVVDNFRTICNQECLCCSKGYMCRSTHERGDWQAYRKERK